jgi:hypothetical protein
MAEEPTSGDPYDVVLADLKAKRTQIDQAIVAIEALRGVGTMENQEIGSRRSPPAGGEVTSGMFHGLNIADAVKQLLAMRKKPLGTQEITESIKAGGVVFSTDTPANTVGSILHRQSAKVGDVISVGRGTWGLAAWYPNPGRFQKKRAASENTPKGNGEGEASEEPKEGD